MFKKEGKNNKGAGSAQAGRLGKGEGQFMN